MGAPERGSGDASAGVGAFSDSASLLPDEIMGVLSLVVVHFEGGGKTISSRERGCDRGFDLEELGPETCGSFHGVGTEVGQERLDSPRCVTSSFHDVCFSISLKMSVGCRDSP